MRVKQWIAAAIVITATGAAFADAGYTPPAEEFKSVKSRSEVIAEMKEAKAQGLMSYRDGSDLVSARSDAPRRTRGEVRSEEMQWAAMHRHREAGVGDLYFG